VKKYKVIRLYRAAHNPGRLYKKVFAGVDNIIVHYRGVRDLFVDMRIIPEQ
jgi:hypothetical protein